MTITLLLKFMDGDSEHNEEREFVLESGVEDSVSIEVSDILAGLDDGWEFVGYEEIECGGFDEPWTLDDFDSLDGFGEFAGRVEEHGEALELRCIDLSDTDASMEEYSGCWDSEEDFVRDLYEDCYDIPDHLKFYIDWDSITHDVMQDCSSYSGSDGLYIFRD